MRVCCFLLFLGCRGEEFQLPKSGRSFLFGCRWLLTVPVNLASQSHDRKGPLWLVSTRAVLERLHVAH